MDTAEELYDRLIAPIEHRMITTVARIVRHPEESADVFQEVLAVVWDKLSRIDRHPNPHAYILRICISRSYDALRRRARRREVPLATDDQAALPATERPAADPESVTAVRDAMKDLPPHQAKALLLRVLDGTSYEAIGRVLGCSEVTARSHCSKGKARLAKRLAELGVLGA